MPDPINGVSLVMGLREAIRERRFTSPFVPPAFFSGGHRQTIAGHVLPNSKAGEPLPTAELVQLRLPDGDTLVGQLFRPAVDPHLVKGLVHIFHGLSGSSNSSYMPRAAAAVLKENSIAVLWNHRGCGAGRGLALEPYHSGRSDDIARAVLWGRGLKNLPKNAPHGVIGYSLSGNATILLSARHVPALSPIALSASQLKNEVQGELPDFAIAVSPPIDLHNVSHRLSWRGSAIYGQYFMSDLIQTLDDRAHWSAENVDRERVKIRTLQARKKIHRLSTVMTLDQAYTGPVAGFGSRENYYRDASSGRVLKEVQIPLVILAADDDPITAGLSDWTRFQKAASGTGGVEPKNLVATIQALNPHLAIDRTESGGHMGYIDRTSLGGPTRWLENQLQFYLSHILRQNKTS